MPCKSNTSTNKLVDAPKLLDEIFDPACRPSLRWLREQQRRRALPFVKVGHLVFFDVEKVRAALAMSDAKTRGKVAKSLARIPSAELPSKIRDRLTKAS